MKDMKAGKMSLSLYRSLYWANQGLLHAVRALREAELASSARLAAMSPSLSSDRLNARLRRTQAMIEETRLLMNRNLAEWIEPNE